MADNGRNAFHLSRFPPLEKEPGRPVWDGPVELDVLGRRSLDYGLRSRTEIDTGTPKLCQRLG